MHNKDLNHLEKQFQVYMSQTKDNHSEEDTRYMPFEIRAIDFERNCGTKKLVSLVQSSQQFLIEMFIVGLRTYKETIWKWVS